MAVGDINPNQHTKEPQTQDPVVYDDPIPYKDPNGSLEPPEPEYDSPIPVRLPSEPSGVYDHVGDPLTGNDDTYMTYDSVDFRENSQAAKTRFRKKYLTIIFIILGLVILGVITAAAIGFKVLKNVIPTSLPQTPRNASFLLQCKALVGDEGFYLLRDLCWVDAYTLMCVQYNGKQVLQLQFDKDYTTCTWSVIEEGYYAIRIACGPDKKVYVADTSNRHLQIYDRDNQNKNNWTDSEWADAPVSLAVNDNFIAIGFWDTTTVRLYDRFLKPLRSLNFAYNVEYMQFSPQNTLLATINSDNNYLSTYDITSQKIDNRNKEASGLNHGFSSSGLSIVPSGNVIISDNFHNRIIITDDQGKYLHDINIIGGGLDNPVSLSVTQGDGSNPLIMAVCSNDKANSYVTLYSLA